MKWKPTIWKGNWPTSNSNQYYWMISLWKSKQPPKGLPKGYWYLLFVRFEFPLNVRLIKVQMGQMAMRETKPLFYEAIGYFTEDTSDDWHGRFSFVHFNPPQYVKAINVSEGERKAWRAYNNAHKLMFEAYTKLTIEREQVERLQQELKFLKEM